MTKVFAKEHGGHFYISATGHATGSVEVCAAISGLLYALCGYLQNSENVSDVSFKLCDADASVSFYGEAEARAVYEMTLIGLLQIEQTNKEYISVVVEEI